MLTINDSAYPTPAPLPAFSTLAIGKGFRNQANQYFVKITASAAWDLQALGTVSKTPTDLVDPVSLTVVVTAP